MNEEIKETEQWLLNGECMKCRREKYCSKPCKKHKIFVRQMVSNSLSKEMNKRTGGLYGYIMKEGFKYDR